MIYWETARQPFSLMSFENKSLTFYIELFLLLTLIISLLCFVSLESNAKQRLTNHYVSVEVERQLQLIEQNNAARVKEAKQLDVSAIPTIAYAALLEKIMGNFH